MRPAVTLRQRPHYDCLRTFPVVYEALVDGVVVRSQLQPLTQDEIERGLAEHVAKYPTQGPAKRVPRLRAAFKQLHLVEPFDEHAVAAVTITRTGNTQPVPEPNVTEWISGDVKPAMPGVYQRMHREVFATSPTVLYSRWDGNRWFVEQVTAEEAAGQVHVSMHQNRPWRGLAEAPR